MDRVGDNYIKSGEQSPHLLGEEGLLKIKSTKATSSNIDTLTATGIYVHNEAIAGGPVGVIFVFYVPSLSGYVFQIDITNSSISSRYSGTAGQDWIQWVQL